ncbi:hypothetical protein JCM3766R1_001905 [Sporobolomyces carnicolor]
MSSEPFLHLKFTSQRPPPQYGHQLPFAHLVDPTVHELPDSLKTDVQREGIQRYLVQNFKEGSFVWEVVKERVSPNLDERREEEDPEVKDSDGMYIVVNRSWARTVGDSKLHLSLYVYQEDKHCATWHAYTDRTISYSRESESTPADAPAEPSDQEQADEQERDGDEEEEADPEPDEAAIPNEDPYSPPSALAQYVASMESRPSSPFEPPERDSERPRFDRPYKEPVADPADVEERVEKEEIKSPVEHGRNTRRKEKTKATSVEVKSRGRSDDEEKEKEEEKARGDRSRDSTRKGRKLAIESDPEEEERSKKDKVKARSGRETSEEEEEEDRRQSTPHIVKSQPIGHRSARKKDRDEEKEEDSRSRSRSPSPVKTRSSRSKKREPSPEPSSDSEARSRSPRSPSHEKDAPSPIPVAKPERGRKPGRAEKEKPPPASPSQSPSRSPSPRPKALSSRSKPATPPLAQDSRSPSPPRPKSRTSRRESIPATRSSRRGKSSPPRRSSPSPPPAPRVAERSHGRRHSVAATTSRPKPAPRIPRAASPKTEQPTWRSVSRNRHRRSDDSDEDTLVRGNMDDDALDIPAGGETTLLKAKPIKHRQSHSKRDEGFDPDEVARARRTAEREKGRGGEREEPQTLKTAVGGWFKSVGTFIAPEAKLAVGTAEGEVHKAEAAVEHWEEAEREEKRKRKAERARRREERRQRREAEEVEKRKKEEELERMVDRAEDAAEDMLETSERLASRKEREAKRDTNKERRSRDTDHGGSGSEDEVSSRRPRHKHKEETTSVQSRSKHRASRPLSPEPEEEKRHSRSRDHRRHEKPSPTHESRSQRHRGEVSDQSDSDHREEEKEAKASARPALRQRAMSISASVDAGLRGLRESVSKIVSDARQVDTEQDEKDRDRERRRAERERRKIDKERKAIEEERRQLEQEAEQVGRSKRRRAERDRKEREDIRLAERAREPRREDVEDFEGKSMDRSESEADTPAHIEAKRNARRNSTTIPIEQIRTLREQQLEAGTRSIPASPVTSKSRHDLPQRERASTRAEMPRSARDDSSDGDSLDVDTSRRPKPALAPPAAPAYPRRLSPAPVVASPVSSYGAYSPTDPPLRPRPVKPSSYRAPPPRTPSEQPRSETLAARFYTPASSGDSSDEADPSRPPSVRTRRGYSSGGSVASERRASHGERGDLRSPAASYRLPRSDSEPEEPPLRRIESFSRTHPSSYPFTTDDEGDYSEPALTTTRLRRGIEAEASSRSTKPHSKNDRFDSAAFEDSEPEAYGRTGSSSAHPRHSYRRDNEDDDRSGVLHGATTKRSSQGREGGGGRRTMVSKPASTNPSSSSVSRTIPGMFNHRERPPIVETRHEDDDDDDEPTGYSTFSRSTTVDPYYSARSDPHDYGYGHRVVDPIIPPSFTPDLENGSSSPPPVRGFTGFDLRHHHSRQLEPSTSSNDGQGRRRGTDGKTGSGKKGLVGRSSVPFGANQAPVGRRMAQRLGVE